MCFNNMTEVIAPSEVSKDTPAVEPVAPVEAPIANTEETIGDVFKSPKEETVPLASHLEIKRENKEAQKKIKELEKQIEAGATKREISDEIKAIAEEHNVDEAFLQKLASAVKAQTEREIEDRVSSKLKPLEDKERAEKIDTIFNQHYAKAIEAMPEYKDLVNKDVIKSLSLDPRNQNKTFTKIIEDSYGHLLKGKATLEPSKPSSRDDNQALDTKKLKDPAYFKEVMANPRLKKEYNDGLIKRLNL
jgi:hypothetical protein